MSKNPFSNLANPMKNPDPRTIAISDFQKHQSHEMERIHATFRSFRKSVPYLSGCVALSLVFCYMMGKAAQVQLFGFDKRGGSYLKLKTIYDEDHYAYNREFQRMHVLGEGKLPDNSMHSRQMLTDLGVNLPQVGSSGVAKRPPHEKFY